MKHPMMLDMQLMSGLRPYGFVDPLLMPSEVGRGHIVDTGKPCGLTGTQWSKRKSRSKIARESRKRNRK